MYVLLPLVTAIMLMCSVSFCHADIEIRYSLTDPWGDETSLIQWGSQLKITCVYNDCFPAKPQIFHARFPKDKRPRLPPISLTLNNTDYEATTVIIINNTNQLGGYFCGHEGKLTCDVDDPKTVWIHYITCKPPSAPNYQCGCEDEGGDNFCYHIYPKGKKRCGRAKFRAEDKSICSQFRHTTTKPICSRVSIESPPQQFSSHCDYLLNSKDDQHDVVYSIPFNQSGRVGQECAYPPVNESTTDQLDQSNTQRHFNLPQLSVIEEGITVPYGSLLKYSLQSKFSQLLPFFSSCGDNNTFQWNLKDQNGHIVEGNGSCSQPIFNFMPQMNVSFIPTTSTTPTTTTTPTTVSTTTGISTKLSTDSTTTGISTTLTTTDSIITGISTKLSADSMNNDNKPIIKSKTLPTVSITTGTNSNSQPTTNSTTLSTDSITTEMDKTTETILSYRLEKVNLTHFTSYPLKLTVTTSNNATAYLLIPEKTCVVYNRICDEVDRQKHFLVVATAANVSLIYFAFWYVCSYLYFD